MLQTHFMMTLCFCPQPMLRPKKSVRWVDMICEEEELQEVEEEAEDSVAEEEEEERKPLVPPGPPRTVSTRPPQRPASKHS